MTGSSSSGGVWTAGITHNNLTESHARPRTRDWATEMSTRAAEEATAEAVEVAEAATPEGKVAIGEKPGHLCTE
jgi:hypothetical protein